MESLNFILLKWGTGKLDSLLFLIPLALLLLIWASSHLAHFIRQKKLEHKKMMDLFREEESIESTDPFVLPA